MPPEEDERDQHEQVEGDIPFYWHNVNNGYTLGRIKECVLECMNPEKTLQEANNMALHIFELLTRK